MRPAFCMVGMAVAALPVMGALPLMDKGAHATKANFDFRDFFLNSF
jgi:hypothetical protein